MEKVLDKYEEIYGKLKACFEFGFGTEKRAGIISIDKVKKIIESRIKPDYRNNLPQNRMIEIPHDLYGELKKTYTSRDDKIVSGIIGCADTPEEQLDGITNMALLIYLSNILSKECKSRFIKEQDPNTKKIIKKTERMFYEWKDIGLTDIIAATYVLSKTSKEYQNYFSYGSSVDEDNQPTFIMDVPYIGQIGVHFGWEERKKIIEKNAKESVKTILEEKLKLGQITKEQLEKITSDLDKEGVLPEYEGKLYEYVGATPIEYIGKNIKRIRKMIDNKPPEEITSEDISKLRNCGLNSRELYYLFIKIGASKELLCEISGKDIKISPESIEKDTEDTTMEGFRGGVKDLKSITQTKEPIVPNIEE